MTIACLAWGSLVWDPGHLPIGSEWKVDGPPLPVEFARKSNNGRITLVLLPGATAVPVLWCKLKSDTPIEARAALASREGITPKNADRLIALWMPGSPVHSPITETVCEWATARELDAVVWTALGPKFIGDDDIPSSADVVRYLGDLNGDTRALAEQYIRRAPRQIRTAYRSAIEQELGWHPLK